MTSILDLRPDVIRRSPLNHRKTFTGIDELAASIAAKGVINPITVREVERSSGLSFVQYELVAGERRWRAAKVAKLETIPCIVRELTDLEVLEVQLVENVQRVDVHPLEEADGYLELIEKHGYDVDQVAEKVGKSKATIYARLKLTALAPYPREAFLEDRLSASIALLIARIPDVELQERATRDVLGETTHDDLEDLPEAQADLDDPKSPMCIDRRSITDPDDVDPGDSTPFEPVPMSVREAQIHLRRRYMLRLALATFDLHDAELVPAAGSCETCEYRSINQRDFFDAGADVCTKPSCYEEKTAAAWALKAAAAEEQGMKVVGSDDSAKVFTPGAQVRPSSPYVDPKAPVPADLLPAGTTKAPTWEKLLGKKLAESAPKVLVQDATGAGHELLDRKKVVEALREAGKIDKPLKPAKTSSTTDVDPYKADRERQEKKRDQQDRAVRAAIEDATPATIKDEVAWWRWIAGYLVSSSVNGKGLDEMLEVATTRAALQQVVTSTVLEDLAAGCVWNDPAKDEHLMRGLSILGVDYGAHLERIKASDKIAAKAEKKKKSTAATDDGKRCGLVRGKNGDGCLHELGHEGLHSDGKATWADPKPKPKKSKR